MSYKHLHIVGQGTANKFEEISRNNGLLPIKVTPFYQKKVEEEVSTLGHHDGPLYRCVFPTEERLTLKAPGEVADFVDDRANMPEFLPDSAVRKYDNRMLFFPTETCGSHCQYCFRTDVLSEQHDKELPSVEQKLDQLIAYLQQHPEVEEVILSGGDPLTIPPGKLSEVLRRLKQDAKIRHIRVHTRMLAFSPRAFSEHNCESLAEANVRLVNHIVHPYEICDEVRRKIEMLHGHGIRLYNQFPILRKVNDHPEVLKRLLTELDEYDIRNLSIFIPDPIKFSASFRVPLERLFAIMDELNWTTSSWVNSTRLVLDTPHGKVRREDLKNYDKETGTAIFEREGHQITYPDLPENMDQPGQLNTLLWKK